MEEFLFVYGTLRQGAAHPMFQVLSSNTISHGTGFFPGKLYNLGSYPAVVQDHSGQWTVRGEVYQLLNPEVQLRELDRYEGCAPASPQPHIYSREKHPLALEQGKTIEGWIYLYQLPLENAPQILNGDYLNPVY